MRARLLLILPVLAVAGCSTVQRFEDVSAASAYRIYVAGEYALRVEMHLSGVHAPPGYGKSIDYYVVNPTAPGWHGPELITRETLPVGTVLRVESVHRCTNCFLGEVVKAKIALPAHQRTIDLPIHIPIQYLSDAYARRL